MDDAVLQFADIRQVFAAPGGGEALTVLDGISFPVRRGEFVAVIGPSGCGKSTLLQMAAGLLVPTGGTVSQDGAPIVGVNRRVGLVPQQAQLYPWKTLLQNVEFPLALRGVKYRAIGAARLLQRNLLIYGLGGVVAPFVGIKLIDIVISAVGLA